MAVLNSSNSLRTSRSNAIVTSAGATAYLLLYSGTIPATPDTAISPNTTGLLASLPCANPIGTVSNGVLTFGTIGSPNATATGTASFCRLVTSASATTSLIDLDVGTTGTSIILNSQSINSGGPIVVSSAIITESA